MSERRYDFTASIDRRGTRALKYTRAKRLFGSEEVIPLWIADMDLPSAPMIAEAIRKRLAHPVYGYEAFAQEAYEALKKWLLKRHGYAVQTRYMLHSHSVVSSMAVAVEAFTQEGEEVVVQPPVYPQFAEVVKRAKRNLILNPLRREEGGTYRFDLEDLRRKITPKTKLLLLCSPHNPVGRVWLKEELEALAKVCIEHEIAVFADEIHSDLVYSPHTHTPFATLEQEARRLCISAVGPGKSFNFAGGAISTVILHDPKMYRRFFSVYDRIRFGDNNIFSHVAFEALYREGEAWLEALLKHLQGNARRLYDTLLPYKQTVAMSMPEGTYLAWLDCRAMRCSQKELERFFVEKAGLGLSSGIAFGKEGEGYMRLNFALSEEVMETVCERIDKALSA